MAPALLLGLLGLHKHRSKCRRVIDSESLSPSHKREADLARSFKSLQASSDLVSLSWLCDALDVVLCAQESLKLAVPQQYSQKTSIEGHQVQQYMEKGVKVMDVCSLLTEALDAVQSYTKASEFSLKCLNRSGIDNRGALLRARHALVSAQACWRDAPCPKQLSAAISMLKRMGDKLIASTSDIDTNSGSFFLPVSSSSMPAALYGSQMAVLFTLRALAAALSPDTTRRLRPLRVSKQPSWAVQFVSLQTRLSKAVLDTSNQIKEPKQRSSFLMLPELVAIDAFLRQIDQV